MTKDTAKKVKRQTTAREKISRNPVSGKNLVTKTHKQFLQLGTMTHTYNPNTLGGRGKWIMKSGVQVQPEPTRRNPVSTKNTKISWMWWHMPVIPATQEAEAGESLEPRRWRLR